MMRWTDSSTSFLWTDRLRPFCARLCRAGSGHIDRLYRDLVRDTGHFKNQAALSIGTVMIAVPMAFVSWSYLLHDYQRERLLLSYDPERDYFGGGFNIVQAHVTIGTGGWFGNGLSGGIQGEYQFLRVRDTDFIFAHSMSMFGFFGGLALMLCFLLLFHRMTRAVGVARDTFGQYIATGITAMLVFQTFINIGMNLGLMPVTGLPLPFISLGGTALVTNLAAIGILQSILINRRTWPSNQDHRAFEGSSTFNFLESAVPVVDSRVAVVQSAAMTWSTASRSEGESASASRSSASRSTSTSGWVEIRLDDDSEFAPLGQSAEKRYPVGRATTPRGAS